MSSRIMNYIREPRIFLNVLLVNLCPWITDKLFLKLRWRNTMGYSLDLNNPQTLNEKIQWLKLYDRKPIYSILADKYRIKDYIKNKFGKDLCVPNIGVWDSVDEINFDSLPNKFVLKCNHNSGNGICICTDKSKLNITDVKKKLEKGLRENYYKTSREWQYKDIPRRIIAEEYLETKDGKIPNDYKLNFINGKLEFVYVSYDRKGINDRCLYDADWKRLPFVWVPAGTYRKNMNTSDVPCPQSFDMMKRIACMIAKDFDYVRVDFYDVDGKLYLGEITLYHGSGYDKFFPKEYDLVYGEKMKLSNKK